MQRSLPSSRPASSCSPGERSGPGSQFAYFDCESAEASVIEILGFDEGTRAFMEQLKQQSAKVLAE